MPVPDRLGEVPPLAVIARVEIAAPADGREMCAGLAEGCAQVSQSSPRRARNVVHTVLRESVEAVAIHVDASALAVDRDLVPHECVVHSHRGHERAPLHAAGDGDGIVITATGAGEGEDVLRLVRQEIAPEIEMVRQLVEQDTASLRALRAPGRQSLAGERRGR